MLFEFFDERAVEWPLNIKQLVQDGPADWPSCTRKTVVRALIDAGVSPETAAKLKKGSRSRTIHLHSSQFGLPCHVSFQFQAEESRLSSIYVQFGELEDFEAEDVERYVLSILTFKLGYWTSEDRANDILYGVNWRKSNHDVSWWGRQLALIINLKV